MQTEHPTLALGRQILYPVLVIVALLISLAYYREVMDGYYLMLAVITFFLSSYLFDDISVSQSVNGTLWRG